MTDPHTDWQRLLSEYSLAQGEYQAARDVAVTHSVNVDAMTAAFLAEELARDKLVLLRRRIYPIDEATVGP